ncbi:ATP-dependent DNA helicase DinG [Aliidiomarina soli]|uniref:ATP-dependent DNA helicase DinG n=1 Tax=Aliidiomarina soli TaxID=1928574 RepID=A0A432WIU3_9GAMM|nr:ATP-dependent DNA helicase DinG [Aliidiomarina soli]RUO33724.1 ATP-dependent DNA helicase DinG [Aliidiomarina soli]
MVPDNVKQSMQKTLNALRDTPGFTSRKGQMTMFAEVAKTLFGVYQEGDQPHRSLVIEGQTGAGKTLGYLLPAIVSAIKLKKHVVVATANVALQQQIMNHDLPRLRKAGLHFEQAFVAGRGRYFCRRDAETFVNDQDAPDLLTDEADVQHQRKHRTQVEQLITLFDANQWNGLKDDYRGKLSLEQPWWSQVNANRDTCSRRNCAHYDNCAFFDARKDVRDAQVIVTNHAMLYADMLHVQPEMRLLPAAKDSIFVFDEAHHIRDTFRSSLAAELNFELLSKLDRNSGRLVNHIQSLVNGASLDVVNVDNLAVRMRDDFKLMSSAASQIIDCAHGYLGEARASAFKKPVHRFEQGALPEQLQLLLSEQLQPALEGLNGACQKVNEKIKDAQEKAISDDSRLQNYLGSLRNLTQTVESALNACVLLKTEINPKQGIARWLTRHSDLRVDITLSATPIQVGRQFEREIVTPAFATIFTSATLQSLGSFRRFSEQLSLYQKDGVQFLVIESPFDYKKAQLVTYRDLPEPNFNNEAAHTSAMLKRFGNDIGEHKAALVLFASKRQMQSFVDKLPAALAADSLVQYTATRDSLVRRHKKRVDEGKRSILIGCQSFSEGLDLPGAYLTFVGIAKLPFADVNCPIAASESEFIEAQGLHPFAMIALPDASRRLVQCVGRLMRSQDCYGEVRIYDSRLQTKGYGKQLLNCLPPMLQRVE